MTDQMIHCREAFEKWYSKPLIIRDDAGQYEGHTYTAWNAWQAAWNTRAQASAPEGGETVPYCKKCGDGIIASDPGICGTCYDTDCTRMNDSPEGEEPVAWKITFGAMVELENNDYEPISKTFVTDSKENAYAHISSNDSVVVPLYTRSNAEAVDVESLIASCVPGGSVCDPQAVADNIREWFVGRSNAKAGEVDDEPSDDAIEAGCLAYWGEGWDDPAFASSRVIDAREMYHAIRDHMSAESLSTQRGESEP